MMANSPADVFVELEEAIATCSQERCARILAGVVRLLATGHDRPREELVDLVDGVLCRLTGRVALAALVQLSHVLADLNAAPKETLRELALHGDPDVACPILLKSQALSTTDLETVATSRGERHRLAIAARDRIEAAVAEALVKHGARAVHLALIENPGTRFSDAAYAALMARAEQDGDIAKALALRPGTPDIVMRRLLPASPGQKPPERPDVAPKRPCPTDYASARPEIVALNRIGKLNDSTVNRFAIRGETANLFTALSVLSAVPIEIIEHVMADADCEGLVMACRASRLNWQTTLAILSNRGGARLSSAERARAQEIFDTLLLSTSQWTVRWGEIAASAKAGASGTCSVKLGGS